VLTYDVTAAARAIIALQTTDPKELVTEFSTVLSSMSELAIRGKVCSYYSFIEFLHKPHC
jgi:hypothetical protein